MVGLLLFLAGCGTPDSGPWAEGPAPTGIPWTGSVYSMDWRSEPRQRPEMMDLTENTVLDDMKWHDWGRPRATATGWVVDLACLSGCPHETMPGYAVTVVLSGLVRREYAAYYSVAAVSPRHRPAPYWAEDVSRVPLHVPKA
ncbi:hypothetical protein ABZ848_06950 [Streptomyces sp. NPDC047081]|uniref:hypothetical protein n=1 Tax=Streptomyces sp. NPDC047081 TaxID=3154706 RepID=UPI00340C083E